MSLFDTEICALMLLDDGGRVTKANPGCAALLDWPAAELEGELLADLAVAPDRPRIERALQRVRDGAPSASVQPRFLRPTGHLHLQLRAARVDGGIAVAAERLDERVRMVTSDAKLRSVVNFASDCWFVHDLDGRIIDANPWAAQSLGYTEEEMLGLHVADFETTVKPGRLDGIWNRMEIGRPRTVEGMHRRKDGTTYPVEVRLGLFEADDNEVLMLAIARDITLRRQQEDAIQRANAELTEANGRLRELTTNLEAKVSRRTRDLHDALSRTSATVEQMADGLLAVDHRCRVLLSNPALVALLDLPADRDLLGRSCEEVLPDALSAAVHQALDDGELVRQEVPLPHDRIASAVVTPTHDEGGANSGAVVILRDVTLEKEVDRMKTDFIATVSHELRTPLTSVVGFAKLTRDRLDKSIFPHVPADDRKGQRALSQVRGNVDIMISEGDRLTALINDVLDISKMEAGRMEWRADDIDAADLIARSLGATASLFTDGGPRLLTDIADDLPPLRGDSDRLMQVLINLVSNAVKFDPHGTVMVRALKRAGSVHITVADEGAGIEPALHEAIFEKFRQVGDTLTGKPTGTGLGLPISKQIVQAHRGEIRVESAPGAGAVFHVVLPAADADPSDSAVDIETFVQRIEHQVEARGEPGGKDILVVDDDPSLRELVRQQLAERGFSVRLAVDGYDAIEQVRNHRPDLVVLDVMMPTISGFDLAAMLKSNPDTATIPIIILSIIRNEERGYSLGVDRYLTKPAETEELVGAIHELLARVSSPRRVLLVDDSASTAGSVVQVLEARGYQVVGTCTGEDCLDEARKTRPDMILVESMVADREKLVRMIRLERALEHVYVVQMVEG